VFAIPELEKPAGRWCSNCAIGKGCKIYESRPQVCVTFKCLWLVSQEREDVRERMVPEMRPDRSKVVIAPATDPKTISFMPMAVDAWRKPEFMKMVKQWAGIGGRVVIDTPVRTRKIVVDAMGEREVEMTEPDADGLQWNIVKEKQHE